MNEIVQNNSRIGKSKAKGNLFENKIAKELGIWIFNDRDILCRHLTSGARKSAWVGDIVPQKQIPRSFNDGHWPFLVECKNGYKNNVPNLNNQNIVRNWLTKSLLERTSRQNIIYLIISFHGYSPLLITDVEFNMRANLIINICHNDIVYPFYIYDFKSLTKISFYSLYEDNIEIKRRLHSSKQ